MKPHTKMSRVYVLASTKSMDKRIRFGEPIETPLLEENLPSEDLLVHESQITPPSAFAVYIVQRVYMQIQDHINQTETVESGGILVGQPFRAPGDESTFVIVTGAIPQDSHNRSVGHFTVGPQEIAAARAVMEREYPGLAAVGWYHSHPGHGIFLSAQDMTIVNGIYNAPWHIAIVIDPLRGEEGIFVGPEGQRLRHAWIGLKTEPDTIRAVALYNQAKDALTARQMQVARSALDSLQDLTQDSRQLRHWHDGYRDVAQLLARQNELLQGNHTSEKQHSNDFFLPANPPQPARKSSISKRTRRRWFVWLLTIMFAAGLALNAYFHPVGGYHLMTMTVLALYGTIILKVCWRIIIPRGTDNIANESLDNWPAYSRAEQITTILAMMIVILSWAGFAVFGLLELGVRR